MLIPGDRSASRAFLGLERAGSTPSREGGGSGCPRAAFS
jgi:hypothetical protein